MTKDFDDVNTHAKKRDTLSFQLAFMAIQLGCKVARQAWDEGDYVKKITEMDGAGRYNKTFLYKRNGRYHDDYRPTIEDLLATDWIIKQ